MWHHSGDKIKHILTTHNYSYFKISYDEKQGLWRTSCINCDGENIVTLASTLYGCLNDTHEALHYCDEQNGRNN